MVAVRTTWFLAYLFLFSLNGHRVFPTSLSGKLARTAPHSRFHNMSNQSQKSTHPPIPYHENALPSNSINNPPPRHHNPSRVLQRDHPSSRRLESRPISYRMDPRSQMLIRASTQRRPVHMRQCLSKGLCSILRCHGTSHSCHSGCGFFDGHLLHR